jgi:hypothetical protein
MRGDLAFAGVPGVVYTPASGFNLPGLAFGHDWLTDVWHYAGTLEHLASWGIVAAAPATARGPAPSVLNLAADLGSTLDIVAGVRLGSGQISVSPAKLALVGDGFGAAAAVFAAAGLSGIESRTRPKAVAALFPAVTKPPAQGPASTLKIPGLVVGAPDDPQSLRTDAVTLADSWAGSLLRIVNKASASGLAERRFFSKALGLPGSHRGTQRTVRALLTGFLLHHLNGDKAYRDFADADVILPKTLHLDPATKTVPTEEKLIALLK